MSSLGIIVLNQNQEQSFFSKIARFGHEYLIDTYLFTPKDIDISQKKIKGKKFCPLGNSWIDGIYPIPMFIYDRCFYDEEITFKENHPYVTWLKDQSNIYFLGHGLPSKWFVYNTLEKYDSIRPYLPKTIQITSPQDIFSSIKSDKAVLIKPSNGSQGKGIFVIVVDKAHYTLLAKKELDVIQRKLNRGQIEHLVYKLTSKRNYLLQPFLSLKTKDGRPFDIRILVQKDEKGKWKEVGRGIRTGSQGNYTSNLSSGGEVFLYKHWLDGLPVTEQIELEEKLALLTKQIPTILEQNGKQLFEVGLDFGYDQDGKLWLLEVNSKPGRNVIITSLPEKEEEMVKAPILYCLYLLKVQCV